MPLEIPVLYKIVKHYLKSFYTIYFDYILFPPSSPPGPLHLSLISSQHPPQEKLKPKGQKKKKTNQAMPPSTTTKTTHETWSLFCVGQLLLSMGPAQEGAGLIYPVYSVEENRFFFSFPCISCK